MRKHFEADVLAWDGYSIAKLVSYASSTEGVIEKHKINIEHLKNDIKNSEKNIQEYEYKRQVAYEALKRKLNNKTVGTI